MKALRMAASFKFMYTAVPVVARPTSTDAQLGLRLTAAEGHIAELQRWRATVVITVPGTNTLAAPAVPPADAVPECWVADRSHFPFVISITDKTHKVAIGYPSEPRGWQSECG